MPQTENPGSQRRFSLWWVCVCFLLAILLLHNPFFTVYNSSLVLHMQHPLSYRGTVASSELRRSRVTDVQPNVYAPEQAVLECAGPSAGSAVPNEVRTQEPVVFQLQMISESLWFRPPPVS